MKTRTIYGFDKFEEIPVGENKIWFDPVEKLWIAEKFEFKEKGIKQYSVIDGFLLLADAIDSAFYNK